MTAIKEAHPLTVPKGLSESDIQQDTLTTRDGLKLYYEVVGEGEKTIVLGNGLGGRLYSWAPILRAFKDRYRFITWDYRGLFESGAPDEIRRLSIQDHAEDLNELLEETGTERTVVAGWSMGVQVGLEFASVYTEKTAGLILLNGTYGQIFRSGFQPLVPIPFVHSYLHSIIEWVGEKQNWIDRMGHWIENNLNRIVNLQIAVSPASSNREELREAMRQYLLDIFAADFENYLRLFQELDAHSVYHDLPHIEVPALIISGGLDVLTPAYLSAEMAERLPNAHHENLWLANHFAMLEYPDRVVEEIEHYLDKHRPLGP